jgi:hypothetical protein
VGNRCWSRTEPPFPGSSSPLEAARGSMIGSTHGAAAFYTVWQGFGRSCSWSRSRSPAKQGLNSLQGMTPPLVHNRVKTVMASIDF